ncbi:cilia- and flagella-associated protein 107 isoform X1 [Nothobranchius furzeri]|nr:cilia- and flagella-associated protein 107 [Nothobranchius furzeri]
MASSTSRVDYKPHWDFKPDVSERRSALLRAEGIPPKMLFGHHHSPSSHSTTEYGWSFAQRPDCFLPKLKFLESDKLELKRSETENPCPLSPTNPSPEKMQSHHSPMTLYQSTYQRHPPDAFCKNRCARASRMLSSHLYSVNNNHKDLNLRQNTLLQVPDPQVHTGTTQAQKHDRGF